MIHSFTYYGVYEKRSPGNAKKAGSEHSSQPELPRKFYPDLQEVHKWKDENGGRAHAPERASNNHTKFIQ